MAQSRPGGLLPRQELPATLLDTCPCGGVGGWKQPTKALAGGTAGDTKRAPRVPLLPLVSRDLSSSLPCRPLPHGSQGLKNAPWIPGGDPLGSWGRSGNMGRRPFPASGKGLCVQNPREVGRGTSSSKVGGQSGEGRGLDPRQEGKREP